ncbi:hypothetical protein ABIE78_006566 [Sinorhizobium fredii]|jgi:hypothetical protein|uniref:hypothetical protein n=1 Tax=Rhizobium fredii TaxID=380 RepID=UPI00059C7671|nr:hypothetical protein [Sinorhizobium fredii]PDT82808.1 hypothetical protein CO676_14565 [Sinorhizobium sp. BJ1]
MRLMKVKKKYLRKTHEPGVTERLVDGSIGIRGAAPGFSYRAEWTHNGRPGTFEAWLISKGVMPKQ